MAEDFDPDHYTRPFQFTRAMHRDVYPAVDPTNPALSASGQSVLVTGAGGAVGSYIAEAWAVAGAATIVLVGRNKKSLDDIAAKIRKLNSSVDTIAVSVDITVESEVQALYQELKPRLPQLNTLVNNSGALHDASILESDTGKWWQDFEVNVKGVYLMTKQFLLSYPSTSRKTVITISTPALAFNGPGFSSYQPSKLAVTRLNEFMQLENPDSRFFSLSPGNTLSALTKPEFVPYAIDSGPLIGGTSLYLNQDRADYLKGTFVSVNWDVEEMEKHQKEIVEKNLLKTAFLHATLGPEGHPFQGTS